MTFSLVEMEEDYGRRWFGEGKLERDQVQVLVCAEFGLFIEHPIGCYPLSNWIYMSLEIKAGSVNLEIISKEALHKAKFLFLSQSELNFFCLQPKSRIPIFPDH